MKTHKNNKRPKKNGKKTRAKKQKGGTIFTPTTKEELKNAVMRWVDGDINGLGNISGWNTSNITDMSDLFKELNSFNEDISRWDVSKVKNMEGMFSEAGNFNQPIGNWNVSNVTNMTDMFNAAKAFNQPIGGWDVSNVTNMEYMFCEAAAFNQPIGDWDVSNVTRMRDMFNNSGYTHEEPSVERSKQRIQDKQNLDNLHEDVVSNTKKLNMSESTRKVLSLKPEQGPGIEYIKEFLVGKKTHKNNKRLKKNKTQKKKECGEDKELNPKTNRCINKCKPGYARDADFKCKKNKK